jgi:hypothetical protein
MQGSQGTPQAWQTADLGRDDPSMPVSAEISEISGKKSVLSG